MEESGEKKQEAVMALAGENMPQVDCCEGCLSVLVGWWCVIFFLARQMKSSCEVVVERI